MTTKGSLSRSYFTLLKFIKKSLIHSKLVIFSFNISLPDSCSFQKHKFHREGVAEISGGQVEVLRTMEKNVIFSLTL